MPQPPGGYGHHDDPPWVHDPPSQLPDWVVVVGYNPPPWHGDDDHHNHPVPPPVVPDTNWHDHWLDQCHRDGHDHGGCQPRPYYNIYFHGGDDGRPVLIINQINIHQVNLYLTNPVTGEVRLISDIDAGRPWVFPHDLPPGDWRWSAGWGGNYYGSGAFRIGVGGYYSDCVRPQYPLVIYYDGYVPQYVPAGGWYTVPGSDYVYTDDGLAYAVAQLPPSAPPADAQPYSVMPTAWTQDPITQAPQVGSPPPSWQKVKSGRSPLPYVLVGLTVFAAAGAATMVMVRKNRVSV